MRKGIYWAVQLAVLAVIIKVLLWAWQAYEAKNIDRESQQALDVDKVCSVVADTGQCFCHHRQTGQRLSIPFRECMSLTGRP
jgi:predicted negative regulator of RcsB-dependent stress response